MYLVIQVGLIHVDSAYLKEGEGMKRYGQYLVKDDAPVYALSVRFSNAAVRYARVDLKAVAWEAERHSNRDRLKGLKRIAFEVRDLPNDAVEETEFYCKPEDCEHVSRSAQETSAGSGNSSDAE